MDMLLLVFTQNTVFVCYTVLRYGLYKDTLLLK